MPDGCIDIDCSPAAKCSVTKRSVIKRAYPRGPASCQPAAGGASLLSSVHRARVVNSTSLDKRLTGTDVQVRSGVSSVHEFYTCVVRQSPGGRHGCTCSVIPRVTNSLCCTNYSVGTNALTACDLSYISVSPATVAYPSAAIVNFKDEHSSYRKFCFTHVRVHTSTTHKHNTQAPSTRALGSLKGLPECRDLAILLRYLALVLLYAAPGQ